MKNSNASFYNIYSKIDKSFMNISFTSKFCKIVLQSLEIPKPKIKTPENPQDFSWSPPKNSTPFLLKPWKLCKLFLCFPSRYYVLNSPSFFSGIAQLTCSNYGINKLFIYIRIVLLVYVYKNIKHFEKDNQFAWGTRNEFGMHIWNELVSISNMWHKWNLWHKISKIWWTFPKSWFHFIKKSCNVHIWNELVSVRQLKYLRHPVITKYFRNLMNIP